MSQILSRWTANMPARADAARRWGPGAALLLAFVALSIVVVPRLDATGTAALSTYDVNAGQRVPGLRLHGLTRAVDGFNTSPFGAGTASFPLAVPAVRAGDKTVMLVTAGRPDVPTRVTLIDRTGARHALGTASGWRGHRIDVSGIPLGGGPTRIEFSATSFDPVARLAVDRVLVAAYPLSAIPEAGRWEVAAWVALAALAALALLGTGRVRRHFLLVPATALTAFLVWPSVVSAALMPLPSDVWGPATHASWIDLDHGLLSGTFGPVSALAVQLFHALTPLTGTGEVGGRTASMLVGVLAIVALYVLGRRVAGLTGGIAIVTIALVCDGFRQSLSTGTAVGTLVLASSLFLLAVHRVLARRDLRSLGVLGAVGAVAVIADATWWPGVVASLVLLAVLYGPAESPRRTLAITLGVFALVALPARVSIAHHANGDLTADVTLRTTYARNVEFLGRVDGAPATRAALAAAPYTGPKVGLGSYVFGDHSLSVVAGGTLSGAYDLLGRVGARPKTAVVGLIAFLLELAGVVYLLILPRLRLFVVIPALLSLVVWFLSNRVNSPSLVAAAPFLPAMFLGGASIVYAAWQLVEPRVRSSALLSALGARAVPLLSRRPRVPQPS
jgi:hypothetical protein